MGRTIVFSGALALVLAGFAGQAHAAGGDEEGEEEVAVPKAKGEGKVQVIVVNGDDEYEGPRRHKHRARKIEAVDGEKPPPGYHVESKSLKGVWVGGISLFASTYFVGILSGAIADAVGGHEDGKYTYYALIPAAGQFIIAAHDEISPVAKVLPFIFCGLTQTAGLSMFIGGLAAKKDVWVSNDARTDPELVVGAGSVALRQKF